MNFYSLLFSLIPPMYAEKLENILRELFPTEYNICKGFIQHKCLLLTPEFLDEHHIPFSRIVQNAGEVIILWPRTYHFGFNQAEAVSFNKPTRLTHQCLVSIKPFFNQEKALRKRNK